MYVSVGTRFTLWIGRVSGLVCWERRTVLGTKAMSDPFVVSWKSSESSRESFPVSHESSVFFCCQRRHLRWWAAMKAEFPCGHPEDPMIVFLCRPSPDSGTTPGLQIRCVVVECCVGLNLGWETSPSCSVSYHISYRLSMDIRADLWHATSALAVGDAPPWTGSSDPQACPRLLATSSRQRLSMRCVFSTEVL